MPDLVKNLDFFGVRTSRRWTCSCSSGRLCPGLGCRRTGSWVEVHTSGWGCRRWAEEGVPSPCPHWWSLGCTPSLKHRETTQWNISSRRFCCSFFNEDPQLVLPPTCWHLKGQCEGFRGNYQQKYNAKRFSWTVIPTRMKKKVLWIFSPPHKKISGIWTKNIYIISH